MIQIPENIDSKYRFVILSALRARQIQGGSTPMLKEPRNKATQIAQRELQEQLVKFRIPEISKVNKREPVEETKE